MDFRILGPLEVVDGDAVLSLGGSRQRALLAVLLLSANEVVSADRLIEDLWAERAPKSGRAALQVRISQLRKALGAAGAQLVTRPPGYVLQIDPEQLDVHRFEGLLAAADGAPPELAAVTLREALALWRGPALADLAYESFAQGAVRRLEELRLAAVERRIEAELALGRHSELVGELETLVAEHPLRERLQGQLMLALYRAGRQAEALASYRAARSALVDELGIEPSAELRQLHEAILGQDEALLAGDAPRPAASNSGARTNVVSESPSTSRRVRLPAPATVLVGRARELAELVALADSHRLITLTGPGGTGKTRLSLSLAAQIADRRADGAVWVSLAMVTDPGLVRAAVATALGGIEDVSIYLQERAMLLVLDNFEQVIDAGPAIGELLSGAPGCAAIVTSRERLGIAGEQEYPVPPLSPDDAAELFTTRARQVKPGFEPGTGVDAICERLDRLPLALELAATRVKVLSEQQLLARLEQRLPLLAAGRDAPAHQSTMRAAIAWSYDLLTEPEQRLFTRLAVFLGSFELEAAEEVCGTDLDTLQSLLDKSLVRRADDGRFFLLATTREYALEELDASDDQDQIRARHARWYFALGVAAGRQDAGRANALTRLRQDPGDVGIALSWALDHDVAAGLPLADSLFSTWLGAGRLSELRRWYERALADPGTLASVERADALAGYGTTLAYSDTPDPARTPLTEALTLYRESGDERNEARVLMRLGTVGFISGYPEEMVKWTEQALPIYERLEDPEGIARSLHFIAEGLRDIGELERSAELYSRGIEIRREHGLGSGAASVHSLGDLSLDKHDLRSAEHYYREALVAARDEDHVRLQAYCLAGLACVAAHNDDATTAGRLWTLAEGIEQRIGFRMLHAERVRYEQTLTPALRDSIDYRAGVASAVDLDPPAAVAELLRS